MSTLHLRHHSAPVSAAHPRLLSAILLAAALTIVAAAAITLLVPPARQAVEIAEVPHSTLGQCAMVPTDAARLACFDQLGKQVLQPPAKGGNAPPLGGR
ncbi:MAG: hypothetical protein QOH67_704 [Hyphomicrobiales bacterium]|jgi:hypothetical protein|nr:hypothetical protein [Hyphomicrobiales bacterium]